MNNEKSNVCEYFHPTLLRYDITVIPDSSRGQCWGQKGAPMVLCQGICDKSHCEIFEEFEDKMNTTNDLVNHPAHYTNGSIECIDALAAATTGLTGIQAFDTANAIKYLWRWNRKNGIQDLDKAIWYIEHLKSILKESKDENN